LERQNEIAKIPDDGGVDLEQTVILLALIKEDVVESDAVEVEVREVFEMLDVTLVAEGAAVPVFPAAWILFFLQII